MRVGARERFAWLRDPLQGEHELVARGTRAAEDLGRDDPLWPGQLATLVAFLLYLALPPALTVGPGWPLPVGESTLLAVSIIATRGGRRTQRRGVSIGLLLVAALFNLVALGLLTHYLIAGGHARGADLLGGGVVIWSTNFLLFGVLYWELDRGGPVRPEASAPVAPDLLFPQMTDDRFASSWRPGFGDYMYVSLTNQTAFSPTDTMPLTQRIKGLMGVQCVAALVAAGIIIARAVNILS